MTLIQLEYFCEVYKCHNFSKAADAMNISQPSISIAISNLETELGVPLFRRSKRQILPTEEGDMLYGMAISLLHMAFDITEKFRIMSEKNLRIDLGATFTSSELAIPQILSTYTKLYPQAQFNLTSNSAYALMRAVENDELPFAIVTMLDTYKTSLSLHTIRYCEVCVVVAQNHPLAGKHSITHDEMKDYQFALLKSNELHFPIDIEAFGVTGKVTITSPQIATLKHMVRVSNICGMFSKELIQPDDGIVAIHVDPPIYMPIVLLWKPSRYFSAMEKCFLNFILKTPLFDNSEYPPYNKA